MIYVFQCSNCGESEEINLRVSDLERARGTAYCVDCQAPADLVITGGRMGFMRSPFRKGYHEHISPEGAYIRDKYEARDIAAENGLTSKYVENLC